MVDLTLSAADREHIAAAVQAAEAKSAGEIVTVIAPHSDDYNDIAQDWAGGIALLALGVYATFTPFYMRLIGWIIGDWRAEPSGQQVLLIVFVAVLIKYLGTRLVLRWKPLRLWLTPRWTKHHRVRARALMLFKVTTQQRTSGGTGILIYLSEDERMAEIVADAGIHAKVDDSVWHVAMSVLVSEVKHGRVADGMVAAITQVGDVLAAHFPRAVDDMNELPDRVIEL